MRRVSLRGAAGKGDGSNIRAHPKKAVERTRAGAMMVAMDTTVRL
jgi:hypothetical protein